MKLLVLLVVCAAVNARRITPKRVEVDHFADDKDLMLPEEDEDKPPSDFKGDVKVATVQNAENRLYGKGKFKNTFETENGIQISQVGKLKDNKTFVVSGSYSYTGADGKRYRVRYTADEFGYHPKTELDIDIPDLMIPEPTKRPAFESNFKKIEFNQRFGSGGNGGVGGNGGIGGNGQAGSGKGGFGGAGGKGGNGQGGNGQGGNGQGGNGQGGNGHGGNGQGGNGQGGNGQGGNGQGGNGQGGNGQGGNGLGGNGQGGKGGLGGIGKGGLKSGGKVSSDEGEFGNAQRGKFGSNKNGGSNLYLPPNKPDSNYLPPQPVEDNIYLPPTKTPTKTPTITSSPTSNRAVTSPAKTTSSRPEKSTTGPTYLPPLSNSTPIPSRQPTSRPATQPTRLPATTTKTIPTRTTPKSTPRPSPTKAVVTQTPLTTRTTKKPTVTTKPTPVATKVPIIPKSFQRDEIPNNESKFTYGKATPPPSEAFAQTKGYLAPATYLPPVGAQPKNRS